MAEQSGTAPPRKKDEWADDLRLVAERQDRAAFTRLYDHFQPRVRAWLMKNGAAADEAEELVQDAMTKIWQKAKQFDPKRASSSAWIFAIARNQRIDLARKRAVRARTQEGYTAEYPLHVEEVTQPDEHLEGADRASLIRRGMKILPTEQKQVVHMAFFEGLSHREIAAHLDLPVGTVKSRIRLAFGRLKNELSEAAI